MRPPIRSIQTFAAAAALLVYAPVQAQLSSSGTLSAAPNPALVNQTVTLSSKFTAGYSPLGSPGAVTGTVTFKNGTATIGTGKLVLDTSGSLAQVATSPMANVPAGDVHAVDLNKDGKPDVLFFDGLAQLHVLLATTPTGKFQADLVTTPEPSCGLIDNYVVGDVNKDGLPDIVLTCQTAGGFVTDLLLNNGNGAFAAAVPIAGVNGVELALGDMDKDGNVDLIAGGLLVPPSCSTSCTYGFMVFKGDSAGHFTLSTTTQTAAFPGSEMMVADVDGDGYLDIVELNNQSQVTNSIDVYANHSGATYGTLNAGVYAPSGSAALAPSPAIFYGFFTGDFNGDGLPDFGVRSESPVITTALNTSSPGTISFAAANTLNLSSPPQSLAVGDFNGDGYSDLLLIYDTTGVTVYDSDGAGGFGTNYPGLAIADGNTLAAAAVDINADGDADVVMLEPEATAAAPTFNAISYLTTGPANATLQTSFGQIGVDALTAVWAGNTSISGSTANTSLTVNGLPTTTMIFSSGTPTEYGQTVTLTATVSPGVAGGTPTGTVTFLSDGSPLGTVTMSGGGAQFPIATLSAAGHSLTATYSGDTTFAASGSGNINQVVMQATVSLSWTPSPSTIPYGTGLGAGQLDATASTKYVASVPGTFTYMPVAGTVLSAGSQTLAVTFTPTSTLNFSSAKTTTMIAVSQATPTISWNSPTPIVVGTPLSATQLNATATGVGGVSLPGTFMYTPAAGAVLSAGDNQALSVSFTPMDTTDYATATGGTTINVIALAISSVAPASAALGDPAKTVTVTGTGFLPNSVVQVNGTGVATTYVSGTTLTAVIPAAYFQTVQTLSITVSDPTQSQTSATTNLPVIAATPTVVFTGPSTTQSATQPTLTFTLTNPYPVVLTGTLTLTFAGTGNVDDPAIQFAAGGRTMTFTIAANSTVTPVIQFQSGTVTGAITVTMTLSAGGQNVTPGNVQPVVITIPPAAPSLTSETLTRSGNVLTVAVQGFSNTREVATAAFHFTAASGSSISDPDITLPATALFATWFGDVASQAFGSTFTYTQTFNLSQDASTIGSVTVTLTNGAGISVSSSAQ